MLIAHKIALDPNNAQDTYMARAAGCARFAYNWALDEWQKQYDAWKADNRLPKPNQMALRRQLNAIKREKFPWMRAAARHHAAWGRLQEFLRGSCPIPDVPPERRA